MLPAAEATAAIGTDPLRFVFVVGSGAPACNAIPGAGIELPIRDRRCHRAQAVTPAIRKLARRLQCPQGIGVAAEH